MPQKATDFIKSMTALKLDESLIQSAVDKGIKEGTIEDDRAKSAIPDDVFQKALDAIEKAAKGAGEVDLSKSQTAAEEAVAKVTAAVEGKDVDADRLGKLEVAVAKALAASETTQRMLALALPGLVQVNRATVDALTGFEKSFVERLDATDAKLSNVRFQNAPKAVSGRTTAAPSPHDEGKVQDISLLKSQVFQRVLAETRLATTDIGRRQQLNGVIGTLPAVNDINVVKSIAADLNYKDLA